MPDTTSTQGVAAVHVRSYPRERASHTHPFHQLVLPLAGRLELEVQGRAGHVAGLSCVLVPAGEGHAFCGTAENRFVVLDVRDALLDEVGASAWFAHRSRSFFFSSPPPAMQLASLLAADATIEESPPEVQRAWAILVLRAVGAAHPPRLRLRRRMSCVCVVCWLGFGRGGCHGCYGAAYGEAHQADDPRFSTP